MLLGQAWPTVKRSKVCTICISMQDPFYDLLVFDWVLALSSTVKAAEALSIPQSTVSRRMRAFQASHRLSLHRQGGALELHDSLDYVNELRHLAQHYRVLHNSLRWSIHPVWKPLLTPQSRRHGTLIDLADDKVNVFSTLDPGAIRALLPARILDFYVDVRSSTRPGASPWRLWLAQGSAHTQHYTRCPLPAHCIEGLEAALLEQGLHLAASTSQGEPYPFVLAHADEPLEPDNRPLDLWLQPVLTSEPSPLFNEHASRLTVFKAKLEELFGLSHKPQEPEPTPLGVDDLFDFSPLP